MDPMARRKVMADTRVLLSLEKSVKHIDSNQNKIRRLIAKIENTKGLSQEEKSKRIDALEEQGLNLKIKFVKRARKLGFQA